MPHKIWDQRYSDSLYLRNKHYFSRIKEDRGVASSQSSGPSTVPRCVRRHKDEVRNTATATRLTTSQGDTAVIPRIFSLTNWRG